MHVFLQCSVFLISFYVALGHCGGPTHAEADMMTIAAPSLNLASIIMMVYEGIFLKTRFGVLRK